MSTRLLGRPVLAQPSTDAGDQLLETEWLGDVVVGASLERGYRVRTLSRAVSTMTGMLPVLLPQLAQDLEAVPAGQARDRG